MRVFAGYLGMTFLLAGACGGGSSGGGTCANLACLQTGLDLMMGCATGATCVLEQDATGGGTACFDNDIKIQISSQTATSATGFSATYTYRVKKKDSLCYTQTLASIHTYGDGGLAYGMDTNLTDGAGTQVLTSSTDQNNAMTVTCPGKEPTAYTASCGYPDTAAKAPYVSLGSAPPTCTAGTCSF